MKVEARLIDWMTVAENIGLALGYARAGGLISWRKVEAFVQAALDKVGCDIAPTARVNSLSRTENLGRDGTEWGGFSDLPHCLSKHRRAGVGPDPVRLGRSDRRMHSGH